MIDPDSALGGLFKTFERLEVCLLRDTSVFVNYEGETTFLKVLPLRKR